MMLYVEEKTQTRRYILDETGLYERILSQSGMKGFPRDTLYRKYYPEHSYNQYLWNEHFEAMQGLRKYLSEHNILDKTILWRVLPVHLLDGNHGLRPVGVAEFNKLGHANVSGFVGFEICLWISTPTGPVEYRVGWHRLTNPKFFVGSYPELCKEQSSIFRDPDTKVASRDWFGTELAALVLQEQKRKAEDTLRSPAPKVHGYYRHYKGKIVRILNLAIEEKSGIDLVVHEVMDEHGKIFVRPTAEWTEYVKRDGLMVPRFERVDIQDFIRGQVFKW